jgi:hypothetical protein
MTGTRKNPPTHPTGSDGTPPRAGDGSAGDPFDMTTPEREDRNRTERRARFRGRQSLSTDTPPLVIVPPVVGAPPAAGIPIPVVAGPVAPVKGTFLTLFNINGFFPGAVDSGFNSKVEAKQFLQDRSLVSDNTFNQFVRDETQSVLSSDVSDAQFDVMDIPGFLFPDPDSLPRPSALHILRGFLARYYLTPVPWDGSLTMGDLLVYVFVMLNFLRDGLENRFRFELVDGLDPDVDFPKTYGIIVEGLGPILSSVVMGGPTRVHLCDQRFERWNDSPNDAPRNPEFLFLIVPIYKMIKAFFPGKARDWDNVFTRTGRTTLKPQMEKIVLHGVYSNTYLAQLTAPGGTGVQDSQVLKGMLFEYALFLSYVNPQYFDDQKIQRKVRAKKSKLLLDHYYLSADELEWYRDKRGVVLYHDGIFTYEAKVLQNRPPSSSVYQRISRRL